MAQTNSTAALPTCDHAVLKLSPQWADLEVVGMQHVPADDEGPAETLVLRNCPVCASTLAVTVPCSLSAVAAGGA